MTLAEHLRLLEADLDWVARRDTRDQELAERTRAFRLEEKPVLDDLASVGIMVDSVWLLYDKHASCLSALQILLHHFFLSYSDRILEGIGRALGVKEARDLAWEPMLKALRSGTLASGAAIGAMNAISDMARPADIDTLIRIISDQALGPNRLFLVRNLTRSKQPQAREALLALRDDSDLQVEINDRLTAAKARIV